MAEGTDVSVLVAAVLILVVTTAGTAGAIRPPAQVDIDADSVSLQAEVAADGDAVWTVTYRLRLDDENASQAFEELAADIESNTSTYLDPFRQRMERTVAGAENATGRAMAVENVTVETRRESQPQVEFGVVTYRLVWTNFAAVDGETVRAGDAIDRLFLDSRTTLRLIAPDGYAVDSASPSPTRTETDEVVWQGQRDFDAGEPRVVFAPEGETPAGTPAGSDGGDGADGGDGTDGTDGTDTPAGGGSGLPVVPLLAVVVAVLLGGAYVVVRRGAVTLPGAAGGDGTTGEQSGASATGGDDEGPPPELLSNEEQVLRLLEENGGRMKQKAVAEELDWTAAKTSQVVGDLRDAGEVESFRLGRENVLTLPEVDIDGGDAGDDGE